MKRKKIGGVFSISTSNGFRLVQYIGDDETGFPIIRIISGFFESSKITDEEIESSKTEYFLKFLIYLTEHRKMAEYVGNYFVPSHVSKPTVYRSESKPSVSGEWHWCTVENRDNITGKRVGKITSEFLALSPWGTWSFPLFQKRLENGWKLTDWK